MSTTLERSRPTCHQKVLLFFFAILVAFPAQLFAANTATVSGMVYTVGADRVQVVWPNARVTLKNLEAQTAVSTVTNDLGRYVFSGLQAGNYEITVALSGFEDETRPVKLEAGGGTTADFSLRLKKQQQDVQVTAQSSGVDTTSVDVSAPPLTQDMLQSLPLLNENFQSALPVLPGVIRGPDGLLNIKGGRSDQAGAVVNSVRAIDPVTGQPAVSLPLEAVGSVRVLSNPFSPEYGRFAGGVVELESLGGTDQWRTQLKSFFPRPRILSGHIVGIQAAEPRLTVSGPLKKGKLYFLESMEYNYVRTPVPTQPSMRNNTVTEMVNSRTQLDWNITQNHRLTTGFSYYPGNFGDVGLGTFNPQQSTANYRQRGYFLSFNEQAIFKNGGFLASTFSIKRFDVHVSPTSLQQDELDFNPVQNFGTYFHREDRNSILYQWAQAFHARPLQWRGTHLFTVGYSYAFSNFDGTVSNRPVAILRQPTTPGADCSTDTAHALCTLSQRITFGQAANIYGSKNDIAIYLLDQWKLASRFSLSYGLRLDHDGTSGDTLNAAPRAAFVWAPTRDEKTAVRGGAGIFYDKVPLNVGSFAQYPAETITSYSADGTRIISGPTTYAHTVPGGNLRVPYAFSWNLQVDRQWTRKLLVRLGYEERATHRDFVVQPVQTGANAELQLLNNGRQHYREFQVTVRWQANPRTLAMFSYVRSQALGDQNAYQGFFGSLPNPIIRPNEYGRLGYDAPNRFLAWGTVGLPFKLQLSPLFEVRTGFPYSAVDNDMNFVGQRNGAGRFPAFASLDAILSRKFPIRIFHRKGIFNAGIKVYNLTDHYNPRELQASIASPNYGQFYNSVPRQYRARLEFEF